MPLHVSDQLRRRNDTGAAEVLLTLHVSPIAEHQREDVLSVPGLEDVPFDAFVVGDGAERFAGHVVGSLARAQIQRGRIGPNPRRRLAVFGIDALAHWMLARNFRAISRYGRTYRWWLVAFWVTLVLYVATGLTALAVLCCLFLLSGIVGRRVYVLSHLREIDDLLGPADETPEVP